MFERGCLCRCTCSIHVFHGSSTFPLPSLLLSAHAAKRWGWEHVDDRVPIPGPVVSCRLGSEGESARWRCLESIICCKSRQSRSSDGGSTPTARRALQVPGPGAMCRFSRAGAKKNIASTPHPAPLSSDLDRYCVVFSLPNPGTGTIFRATRASKLGVGDPQRRSTPCVAANPSMQKRDKPASGGPTV